METILNYEVVDKISENAISTLYRCHNRSDNTDYLIKVAKRGAKNSQLLRYEYDLLTKLKIGKIVAPIELCKVNNEVILLYPDIPQAITLKGYLEKKPLTTPELLNYAVKITNILQSVHDKKLIHKNINSNSLIISEKYHDIFLMNFEVASSLKYENQKIINPQECIEDLQYISPEQTGCMNRTIDHRCDFYSLGVVLYEMATRKLPFISEDPRRLIHYHISKQPQNPNEHNSDLPTPIADIILKLLSKDIEQRYASINGIQQDLETCIQQLKKTGNIQYFSLSKHDISDEFKISQKLYGRKKEVQQLYDSFERVVQNQVEMTVISGYSGIGKSSLVHELYKPLIQSKGRFCFGKFDQLQRSTPYSAWIQAFQGFIQQLLTENNETLHQWRERFNNALAPNAQIMIDLLPDLELIIGNQPSPPELNSPGEIQVRFFLVMKRFLQTLCRAESPLVFFLDDLQWIDSSSLRLLELALTDFDLNYLLIIGAYRDNEVSPSHPLTNTITELKKRRVYISHQTLRPLSEKECNTMIADTLHCTPDNAQSLSEVCYKKTQGNPFFINQLLQTLYDENLITFDKVRKAWAWDMFKIQTFGINDDVVELMVSKLKKIEPESLSLLQLASCIGNPFRISTLIDISEKSQKEISELLWPCLVKGYVIPQDDSYKYLGQTSENIIKTKFFFFHDRVQQAAYSMLDENQKMNTHLKVARLLMKNISDQQKDDHIFQITNQYNAALELISDEEEKVSVAKLNLISGTKAKSSAAHHAASEYFQNGIMLLNNSSWDEQYEMLLDLHKGITETSYLQQNIEQMNNHAEIIHTHAKDILDRVDTFKLQIAVHASQNEITPAIRTGIKALKEFGVNLKENPSKIDIIIETIKLKFQLNNSDIKNLAELPDVSDKKIIAIFRLMNALLGACYLGRRNLLAIIGMRQLVMGSRYGCSPQLSHAVAVNAILSWVIGNDKAVVTYDGIAEKIMARYGDKVENVPTSTMLCSFIKPWIYDLHTTIPIFKETIENSYNIGQVDFIGYGIVGYCRNKFLTGVPLHELKAEVIDYFDQLIQLKQYFTADAIGYGLEAMRNLMGESDDPKILMGPFYNEAQKFPSYQTESQLTLLSAARTIKLMLNYTFCDYMHARENAKLINYGSINAFSIYAIGKLFSGLTELEFYESSNSINRKKILKAVYKNLGFLKKWMRHSPTNYSQKYYILRARLNMVLGDPSRVMGDLGKAMSLATRHQYIQDEALAYELATRFFQTTGQEIVCKTYLKQALRTYQQWGASAKVDQLREQFSEYLEDASQSDEVNKENHPMMSQKTVDFETLIKSAQNISQEIELPNLFRRLLSSLVITAGAEKGMLILRENNEYVIKAVLDQNQVDSITLTETPLHNSQQLPHSIVQYVLNTSNELVLDNAVSQYQFSNDPYIKKFHPKSVLCIPLTKQGINIGVIYLENHASPYVFTADKCKLTHMLSNQATISIQNALYYQDLKLRNQTLENIVNSPLNSESDN